MLRKRRELCQTKPHHKGFLSQIPVLEQHGCTPHFLTSSPPVLHSSSRTLSIPLPQSTYFNTLPKLPESVSCRFILLRSISSSPTGNAISQIARRNTPFSCWFSSLIHHWRRLFSRSSATSSNFLHNGRNQWQWERREGQCHRAHHERHDLLRSKAQVGRPLYRRQQA